MYTHTFSRIHRYVMATQQMDKAKAAMEAAKAESARKSELLEKRDKEWTALQKRLSALEKTVELLGAERDSLQTKLEQVSAETMEEAYTAIAHTRTHTRTHTHTTTYTHIQCVFVCVYTYIYIHTYRCRQRPRRRHTRPLNATVNISRRTPQSAWKCSRTVLRPCRQHVLRSPLLGTLYRSDTVYSHPHISPI